MADEEDIAGSVMESLLRAAQKGRFPDLADRHDLWRLLLRITVRKVVDLKRRESRKRSVGGRVKTGMMKNRAVGLRNSPMSLWEFQGGER